MVGRWDSEQARSTGEPPVGTASARQKKGRNRDAMSMRQRVLLSFFPVFCLVLRQDATATRPLPPVLVPTPQPARSAEPFLRDSLYSRPRNNKPS